eukprot:gene11160-13674_t
MCDSEAEKILFILNKHERAYRRLIPVYIFLAIVLWILPILLIVYLYFCIVDNEFLRIGFCIAWTAYYFLSLFKYFVKYFFPLDREDLLNLMDLAKDSPDAKQELLERLLSGKRMTGRDEMDIKRILKTKEALDNIRNFIDKQQLTNSDTPKKSTVPNEDKKGNGINTVTVNGKVKHITELDDITLCLEWTKLREENNRLYEINNQANRGWRGFILRLIGVNLPDKRTEFTQRLLLTRKISGSVMKK